MPTPRFGLPYIVQGQAQKEVTHNEALNQLDALIDLYLLDRDLAAPPGSPTDGDTYLIAASPTGAWTGHAWEISCCLDGAWRFYTPTKGLFAYVADEGAILVYAGTSWVNWNTLLSFQGPPLVGVNTTADASNRLAVKSNAALFSHDDVTPGTGDLLVKMNKASAARDASLVLQDGWSTRAMLGLLASDEFTLKLSPDATNFFVALRGHKDLHGRLAVKDAGRSYPIRWRPRAGTTSIDVLGLGTSNTGTVTVVAPTSSNLFTQSIRNKITSAATAGSAATLRGAQLCLWRGNSTGLGGFYLCMRGGIESFQATCRMFMGLYSAAADIANVNPSTLLNMVGIGFDSSQTTLRLLRNDGSGTATAVDLGAGFPTTGSQILYELILSAEPNGSEIRYRVERLNSGDLAEGVLTTDLPVATQFLTPHFWLNNGTTAAAVELAVVSLYAEPASLLGSRGSIQ